MLDPQGRARAFVLFSPHPAPGKDNLPSMLEMTCSILFWDTRFVMTKCIGERTVTLVSSFLSHYQHKKHRAHCIRVKVKT